MATIDNLIRLSAGELKPKREQQIKEKLTFTPNPQEVVWVYRERKRTGELWLPRGAWQWLPRGVQVKDRRSFPKLPKLETTITLDLKSANKSFVGQRSCVESMFKKQQGIIHRQPGTGKTQVALYFIAKAGTRSLVIVHTEDILNQWIDYAQKAIPDIEIGVVRQNKADIRQLTIATMQTLYRRNYPVEWWRQFGATILDECHHGPANTFDLVLQNVTSRYKFGMSASETRADNMQTLVSYHFGKTIHKLEFSSPVPVRVIKVRSKFDKAPKLKGNLANRRRSWQGMIKRLVTDPHRNKLIADRVNRQLKNGRSVLVLSQRIEHLQLIKELLDYPSEILAAQLLPGADGKRERKRILNEFRNGTIKCVLATQLADEALDVPILSCVCLAFPAKHADLILQRVGRALREFKGKQSAVIIDVADTEVETLAEHWRARRKAYRRWGFKIKGDGLRSVFPSPAYALKKPRVILGRPR